MLMFFICYKLGLDWALVMGVTKQGWIQDFHGGGGQHISATGKNGKGRWTSREGSRSLHPSGSATAK